MPISETQCSRCERHFPSHYRIEVFKDGEAKYYDPICALAIAPDSETYKLFRDRDKQEKLTDFVYDLLIPPPIPIEELQKRGVA